MTFIPRLIAVLAISAMTLLSPGLLHGQGLIPGLPGPAAEPAAVSDPLGRGTPRGLVFGYLQAISAGDYERASFYLGLPTSSETFRKARGARLAKDLKVILDRGGILNDNWTISDKPEGNPTDSLDLRIDQIGKIVVDGVTIPFLAERTPQENGPAIWLVAPETVARIPDLLAVSHSSFVDLVIRAIAFGLSSR